jgi:hypothetical protein
MSLNTTKHQAFQHVPWDSPKAPEEAFLRRLLERDGLNLETLTYPAGFSSPEQTLPETVVWVLVQGCLQVACPGYGVVELHAGCQLTLQAATTFDLRVLGGDDVLLLQGKKAG